jgi:hypothetical protein
VHGSKRLPTSRFYTPGILQTPDGISKYMIVESFKNNIKKKEASLSKRIKKQGEENSLLKPSSNTPMIRNSL